MSEFRFPKEGDRLDHGALSRDPKVNPWVAELALRSKLTAEVNLRRLGLFLHTTHLTTSTLLTLSTEDPERLRALLIEYATEAKERKYLGTYVRRIFVSVRGFLRFHRSAFNEFPRVSAPDGESLVDERVPTQDELRLLLSSLTPRGRVVALMMAHAGLRPGVLGDVNGGDGLSFGDLREVRVVDDHLEFEKIPFVVVVPARLSKIRKSYLTFGSRELAEALDVYARERLSRGERLEEESPVVASTGQGRGSASRVGKFLKPAGRFVSTKAIAFDLRDAIRKVRPGGQVFRPYTLRSYCSTQFLLSESRGFIVRDARELFLGHDLGAAGRYHLGKKLHPSVVEELRSMYERSYEFLSTTPKPETGGMKAVLRAMLMTLGYSEEQIVPAISSGETGVSALLKSEPEGRKAEVAPPPDPTPGAQRVVSAESVEEWLTKGWTFVSSLGSDRAVLRA